MSDLKSNAKAAGKTSAGAPVRARAAQQLAAIINGTVSLPAFYEKWANDADDQASDAAIDDRDRGLQRALVSGALRWHFQLQTQLKHLLSKPLGSKDAELSALIQIGLLQLQHMRIPDHAAVAATVEATVLIRRRHARGLVNAVLRRFLRERAELESIVQAVPEARCNHPQWFISAVEADWPQRANEIMAANDRQAPMWLRINHQRTTSADYTAQLDAKAIPYEFDSELDAALKLVTALPVAQLPGYTAGLVSLQDRAAQLAATYVAATAGQRILDACAAPGGKTAHLLERYPEIEEVVALDLHPDRLQSVRANLDRLGLSANLICGDACYPDTWWDGRQFDRILVDAPCSATGVIRRHPDIKLLRTENQVQSAVQLQQEMLVALWPLLAQNGRLVYSTCSVLRRENDRQIAAFLAITPDAVLTIEQQYFPGEADGDGFYYACLTKQVR